MLTRLVEEREGNPGQGLSVEELFAAGWPGEKSDEASSKNRVWVTLAAVRKMGLVDVLKRDARGYFPDPTVPLRVRG